MSYSSRFDEAKQTHHQAESQQRPRSTILNFGPESDGHDEVREALLRESGSLTRSEQLLDEQFDIAIETRENLIQQRWTIKSMQRQFNDVTNRFTGVNALMKKIGIRKRRDTIIVAVVFCLCLVIFLYNVFL